eukprot:3896406-Rhodomonas_salina.1
MTSDDPLSAAGLSLLSLLSFCAPPPLLPLSTAILAVHHRHFPTPTCANTHAACAPSAPMWELGGTAGWEAHASVALDVTGTVTVRTTATAGLVH